MLGTMFGPYRIDDLLGRGGMGEVYKAYDTQTDRTVALKLLPTHLARDDEYQARFRRECRVAARLSEPHVVPIHRFGDIDGRLYLDMRLVKGMDLGAWLRRHGPMPADVAVTVVNQVAAALDAAHSDGLVHRDVKPSNILMSDVDGPHIEAASLFVYLFDFGIARAREGAVGVDAGSLTMAGMMPGSPSYVAPERFQGVEGDPRADVYALACVLYQTLTGRPPFVGDLPTLMRAHLMAPPPRASARRPDIPTAFDDVVATGMAKDPAARYATAGALAADARHAVSTWPASAEPTAPISRPPPSQPVRRRPARTLPLPPPDLGTGTVRVPAGDVPPHRGGETLLSAELRRPLQLHVPLDPRLTFNKGPLRHGTALPFLENQAAVDEIRQRIQFAAGGALLVAGFNGVGKTTVVSRAIAELHDTLRSATEPMPVVDMWIKMASPIGPDAFMTRLIRRLYVAMEQTKVLGRLGADARQRLEFTYVRSYYDKVREARTHSREWGGELGAPNTVFGIPLPSAKVNRKRIESIVREGELRPLTVDDMEQEFLRIVEHMQVEPASTADRWPGLRPWRDDAPRRWQGRLVVVVDELDKLTVDDAGTTCFASLLTSLKNVLTAADVSFVFVTGTDVLARVLDAYGRGSGVWNDVFGANPAYVPCLSVAAARTMMSALAPPAWGSSPALDDLCRFLSYRARGVARQLLAELEALVTWPGGVPTVAVDDRQVTSMSFFAGLQRRIGPFVDKPLVRGPLTAAVDVDRRRYGAYLMADWALRRGNATFSLADFCADPGRPDVRIVPDDLVRELLNTLASAPVGVLEQWMPDAAQETLLDVPHAREPVYRLAPAVLAAVTGVDGIPVSLGTAGAGRYVLVEELGRGALSRTYRATYGRAGYSVAVKLLDVPGAVADELALQRFRREAELARRLSHGSLVRIIETLDGPDDVPGIVMEYVEGPTLDRLLAESPLDPRLAVVIAVDLVDLLTYLDDQGVVRLGLKPSNVVWDGRRAILTEFGLARGLGEARVTATGVVLGTPRYIAPEQLEGDKVDVRADLYTVGLLLYEMLTGRPARPATTIAAALATQYDTIDTSVLPCSAQLRAVVATLLAVYPHERPATPRAARTALLSTAEARQPPC